MEQEGRKERKKTFNYEFIKWNIEPYGEELEKDIEHLKLEGLIDDKQGVFITKKGKSLLENQKAFFKINKIDNFFKFSLYSYKDYSLYELVNLILQKYEIARYGEKEIISEIVEKEEIRQKRSLSDVRRKINNTYDELERNDEIFMKKIQSIMRDLSEDDALNEEKEK